MLMERIPVCSSDLASVGYDRETFTLEIEFKSGSIYQYFNVPYEVYEGLMNAISKGTYFQNHIRNSNYSYVKIREKRLL